MMPAPFDVRTRKWAFRRAASQSGFTLIEIMVVIIILGILAMYVAPKLMGRPDEAKQVRARMDIAALETALKRLASLHATREVELDDLLRQVGAIVQQGFGETAGVLQDQGAQGDGGALDLVLEAAHEALAVDRAASLRIGTAEEESQRAGG